jgi:selenocysteine-specific elongation factor
MRVIATAGHVDHGKSTLVKALTGINPDRLAEEQARQMTIDLGFAWLRLPGNEVVGIVDVPGHEDFIENMLAGVGGVDAALLIIAADEGIMPQTREHLVILELLNIPRLIVALTKIDLVTDAEWLELVELDIAEKLAQTRFGTVPIVPVSAHTGQGLALLIDTLAKLLADLPPPATQGVPRLPIDRVFTLSGFGTVVTGTLLDGALQTGDVVEIVPANINTRIRGLQSHSETVARALPGSRVAVNLTNVDKSQVRRGDVLTLPEYIFPTTLVDVWIELVADAVRPLEHNAEVKVFAGPSEALARVRLLTQERLSAGENTWAQLQLTSALPVVRGQRFILRFPSPPATIGGGMILDTAPGRKWKRNQAAVVERFERLMRGTPLDIISEALIQAQRPMTVYEVAQRTQILPSQLAELSQDERVIMHGDWLLHQEIFLWASERVQMALSRFHHDNPLRLGMSLGQLARILHMEETACEVLLGILAKMRVISITRHYLHLPDFKPQYTRSQQEKIEQLWSAIHQDPHSPPSVKDAVTLVGNADVLDSLIQTGELVRLGADVILPPAVFEAWTRFTYARLRENGEVRLAEIRDAFNTSRKYVLAFLDHLESLQLTQRVGEIHRLGRADWSILGFNTSP